jgi:hypothetical protein
MPDDKLQRRLAGWALSPMVQAERAEHRRRQLQQQRVHEQRRDQDARQRQRLAALEHELRAIKSAATQAQAEQQRQAALQRRQQLFDELGQIIRPPQPQPAQPIYYMPTDGTAQLGFVDFNADLLTQPLRWW